MLQESLEFIKREFFKYYYENLSRLVPPEPIRSREFGFFLEKDKGMFRHKCFNSLKDFHEFVLNEIPLDIYVSAANYEDPGNRDMSGKKLINAELFFDIDAEPTDITDEESAWICRKCGGYDLGWSDRCPVCGIQTELIRLVSEKQLKEALRETEKLIRVLLNDFGIVKENMHVFFSGNRGYHVHINQKDFINIGGEGRREIVDYLLVQGLDHRELLNLLIKGVPVENVDSRGVKIRVRRRVAEMMMTGRYRSIKSRRERILKMLEDAVEEIKVRIDPVVTIDMHRLMRMPESINSSSGMAKKRIRYEDLLSFKPLEEAIALGNEETSLKVKIAPKFNLGGGTFGPFKDEKVELPTYAAVYLICKGVGEYAGE
ncbi:MAG: DNA primase small subunit domain-containing protein [Thermoproteota archaeon]